jgi:long-chain acyl-CoA synthetase
MELRKLSDFFYYQQSENPLKVALAGKKSGKWLTYTTEEVIHQFETLSSGLYSMGIRLGDRIGIVSNNRPEWVFADQAIIKMGCINVPIYPTITDEDYTYILKHAEVKVLFISSIELYKRISGICKSIEHPPILFTFDEVEGANHWTEIQKLANGENLKALNKESVHVQSDDLATIIYTSGTTGFPKGVMLSHRNIISNIIGSRPRVPVKKYDRGLSFLPLCHIYERMIHYLLIERGIEIWFAESMDTIAENIKEVKPQVFASVPRLLEKVYDKIVAKGHELTGIKKMLFFWALNLGLRYELKGKNGAWYEWQLSLANKIIFSKWREALGGNLVCIVSGAAALQPRLARVFWSAGIHVLEGYGLTETSPVIAVNYLTTGQVGFGTVGPPLENIELKFKEDGEIVVRGDSIMLGYYKQPELTREVLDEENWFHTGDIGQLTSEGYLKITDRKKEIFKTSGGKYVAPQTMENKFKESIFIEQIMVIGENQKFPAALIVPDWLMVEKWAKENSYSPKSNVQWCSDSSFLELVQNEVNRYNKEFGSWEQVKKFVVLPDVWSVLTGELTPTLKLKRKFIQSKYLNEIRNIYE